MCAEKLKSILATLVLSRHSVSECRQLNATVFAAFVCLLRIVFSLLHCLTMHCGYHAPDFLDHEVFEHECHLAFPFSCICWTIRREFMVDGISKISDIRS